MQPVVLRVIKGDTASLSLHRSLRLLHNEGQQVLQVIDGTDKPVNLIKRFDLQSEDFSLTLRTRAAAHMIHVPRLMSDRTNGESYCR